MNASDRYLTRRAAQLLKIPVPEYALPRYRTQATTVGYVIEGEGDLEGPVVSSQEMTAVRRVCYETGTPLPSWAVPKRAPSTE